MTGPVERFVAQAYDTDASEYLSYRDGAGRAADTLIRDLVRKALRSKRRVEQLRIVDLGCGIDRYISEDDFGNYLGIDRSRVLLDHHALRHSSKVQLLERDVGAVDFRTLSFNVVISVLMLNYFAEPSTIIDRVRRPGAQFCFVLPNPAYDIMFGIIRDGIVTVRVDTFTFVYYQHNLDELRRAIRPADKLQVRVSSDERDECPGMYIAMSGTW